MAINTISSVKAQKNTRVAGDIPAMTAMVKTSIPVIFDIAWGVHWYVALETNAETMRPMGLCRVVPVLQRPPVTIYYMQCGVYIIGCPLTRILLKGTPGYVLRYLLHTRMAHPLSRHPGKKHLLHPLAHMMDLKESTSSLLSK